MRILNRSDIMNDNYLEIVDPADPVSTCKYLLLIP